MQSTNGFFKKNKFFIFLLVVLLSISGGLMIFTYLKNMDKNEPPKSSSTNTSNIEEEKKATIDKFEGRYDATTHQVSLEWTYESNASKVNSVTLFYKEGAESINVTAYRIYEFNVDLFGLHTGDNTFTLQLNLDDGTTVKQTISVYVNFVLSMKQSVKQSEKATEVTLTYVYDSLNPVEVPSIYCFSSDVDCSLVNYKETKKTQGSDGRVTAQTTYEFVWNENPVTYQSFDVRWKFDDALQSIDLQVVKGTK